MLPISLRTHSNKRKSIPHFRIGCQGNHLWSKQMLALRYPDVLQLEITVTRLQLPIQ